jgi:hypothetical protein
MGDEPVLVLPGEPDGLPPYPVSRQDPLDVQAEYLKLVGQRPITAVRLPSDSPHDPDPDGPAAPRRAAP